MQREPPSQGNPDPRSHPPFSSPRRWLSYLITLGSVVLICGGFTLSKDVLPIRFGLPMVLGFSLLFFCGGLWIRDAQAASLALLGTLITLFLWVPSLLRLWPLPLILAVACHGVLVRVIPPLRSSISWFRMGRINRNILLLMAGTILVSSVVLFLWHHLSHPDVSDLQSRIPWVPLWMLPFLAIGFSLANAAAEEVVYRGVMYASLERLLGSGWVVILIQAIAFGVAHVHGFPRGLVGVLLAAFYGGMMGIIRYYAQGLFAPWLTHVFADVTIFIILVSYAAG